MHYSVQTRRKPQRGPVKHSRWGPLWGENFFIFLNGAFYCTLYFWATATSPKRREARDNLPPHMDISMDIHGKFVHMDMDMDHIRGGDYRGDGGDASPPKILVEGTQMQASPQQLPLLAMSSPHCLEEIAATGPYPYPYPQTPNLRTCSPQFLQNSSARTFISPEKMTQIFPHFKLLKNK